MQKDQYRLGRKQVYSHQYQTLAKYRRRRDRRAAVEATARRYRSSSAARTGMSFPTVEPLVDPSTCTTGPGVTVGPGPGFLKTTCTDGPTRAAVRPRRQLHAGSHSPPPRSTTGSRRVRSRRRHAGRPSTAPARRSADPARGLLHLHLHASVGQQQVTPVASCGPHVAGTRARLDHDHVQPAAGADQLPVDALDAMHGRTRPVTDGSFVTTTCTKPVDTAGYVATGTPVASPTRPDASLSEGHLRDAGDLVRRRGRQRLVRCGHRRSSSRPTA